MTTDYYPENLLKDYHILLQFFPSHIICRPFVVEAIRAWKTVCVEKETINILEVGPGYGETTELILKNILCNMTLVEMDNNSLRILQDVCKDSIDRLTLVREDALLWIKHQPSEKYDVFTASWVLHNFPKEERYDFLQEVARVLKPNGLFVIFDKVLPDDRTQVEHMWGIHLERLKGLDVLGKSDLKNIMIAHEERDALPPYVWHENDLINDMEKISFKKSTVIMRNERDIVFSAIRK